MKIYRIMKNEKLYSRIFYLALAILSVHTMFAQTWDFSSLYEREAISYYGNSDSPFMEGLPSDKTLDYFNHPFYDGISPLALDDDMELGGVQRVAPIGSGLNIFIFMILCYIFVKAGKRLRRIYVVQKQ